MCLLCATTTLNNTSPYSILALAMDMEKNKQVKNNDSIYANHQEAERTDGENYVRMRIGIIG
jgi:hypothetical protein